MGDGLLGMSVTAQRLVMGVLYKNSDIATIPHLSAVENGVLVQIQKSNNAMNFLANRLAVNLYGN